MPTADEARIRELKRYGVTVFHKESGRRFGLVVAARGRPLERPVSDRLIAAKRFNEVTTTSAGN